MKGNPNPLRISDKDRGHRKKIYEDGGKKVQFLIATRSARVLKGNTEKVRRLLDEFAGILVEEMTAAEFAEKSEKGEV
jgi:hypothetical protein